MKKIRNLTEQECEILRQNPNVKLATSSRFSLTFECRTQLYHYLEKHGYSSANIRTFLDNVGIDTSIFLGTKIICNLKQHIQRDGKPTRAKNKVAYQNSLTYRTNVEDNVYLIHTGRFIQSNNGISFAPAFINDLYHKYPDQSIEEGLLAAGINPDMVGYQRIYNLKRQFDGDERNPSERTEYSDEMIQKYKNHPYVKRISKKQFSLEDSFYNEAHKVFPMHIDDVLDIFEIEHSILSISTKNILSYKLRNWKCTEATVETINEQTVRIQRNIMKKMEKKAFEILDELHDIVPFMNPPQRKSLCRMIDKLPPDPAGIITKRFILNKIGISKTSYYSCLKNNHYGKSFDCKEIRDQEDIKVIKQVLNHDPYPQGVRMVYMRMKKITGHQFGLNKVRRLMRKADLLCTVRKGNSSRKKSLEMLKKYRKDNLLKRTFRLHKPHEVFLTDVTYIDFGNHNRAYASACKDGVTGRLYSFDISESNDLDLVMKTIDTVGKIPHPDSAIFHSDQGVLYLTESFQKKVSDYGFIESMSKRGNCWDNASQESFFGHFKDEVDYQSCNTFEELTEVLSKYFDYYNNERPQWSRNRMTPMEYESYMTQMTDEEYNVYLQNEQLKYNQMKDSAAKEAKERAMTLGI